MRGAVNAIDGFSIQLISHQGILARKKRRSPSLTICSTWNIHRTGRRQKALQSQPQIAWIEESHFPAICQSKGIFPRKVHKSWKIQKRKTRAYKHSFYVEYTGAEKKMNKIENAAGITHVGRPYKYPT